MKGRVILSGYLNAYTNMAMDEAIFTYKSETALFPTLRLYRWEPEAISIGYFQKAEEIKRWNQKIGFVRRFSGGGAVYHHKKELTYCFVSSVNDFVRLPTLNFYTIVCQSIMKGLKLCGIKAEMKTAIPLSFPETLFCFSSPSQYDIFRKGRKIVGNAQRRRKGVILQHGSILLEDSLTLNFAEVSNKIRQGFEEELNVEFKLGELTKEEINLTDKLRKTKYTTSQWNFKF